MIWFIIGCIVLILCWVIFELIFSKDTPKELENCIYCEKVSCSSAEFAACSKRTPVSEHPIMLRSYKP